MRWIKRYKFADAEIRFGAANSLKQFFEIFAIFVEEKVFEFCEHDKSLNFNLTPLKKAKNENFKNR